MTFDLKAPTFRHLAYDGYKATRHPMPDELAMQLPMMKDILRAMRIPIFECEGWEADDVIRHDRQAVRQGELGLRDRHRRSGFPAADRRACDGQAGVLQAFTVRRGQL